MYREEWSREIARLVYGLEHSVRGDVIDIDEEGYLVIKIGGRVLRIVDLVKQHGFDIAYIRVLPLIEKSMRLVYETFREVMEACGYKGSLVPVYPMKVNPTPVVIESIFKYGEKYNWGFNTGSLGELLLLAELAERYTPRVLVYDGVFTERVVEALLKLKSLGWRVIVDIESEHEAEVVEKHPELEVGIRVKPITKPHGKWSGSTGLAGKFGLTINTLVKLREDFKWITERSVLLHMHPGSQISRFRDMKKYIEEVRETYRELLELGFESISMIDPGGGLAYPYIDARDGEEESPDYGITDYANLLVSEFSKLPNNPHMVFEGGRFIVASHRLVVSKVIDVRPYSAVRNTESSSTVLSYLEEVKSISDLKAALSKIRGAAVSLRSTGELDLKRRELYEDLIALLEDKVAEKLSALILEGRAGVRDVLSDGELLKILTSPSRRYVLNMSIFADIPDAVLVDQYFQIVPAHELNKPPDLLASIADLTCDSMGEISHYISLGAALRGNKPLFTRVDSRLVATPGTKLRIRGVPMPLPTKNTDYYVVVLDTGAYQDTLAMKHNLIYGAPEIIVDVSEEGVSIRVVRNGELRV
jgi:arginine decarboxylase